MLPTSLVFAGTVLAASSAPVPALPRVRGLDAAAQGQLEAKGLPGLALAVLEGDELVHLAGYGRAAISPERTVEADTPFELASISKQFAAAAAMRLVEEGRLDLDQEVKHLLPELRVHGGALRVRHLLGQTSGLPELLDLPGFETLAARPSRKSSLEDLLRAIAGPPLRFPPDSFWAYSNSNYTALAALVERASSKPYARFLKDLLKPLGLEAIAPCHTLPRKGRADVYRSTAEGLRPVPPDTNPHTYTGNGDLCGTARDLARWTRALATGRVVSAESYRRMVTPGPVGAGFTPPYGYGLSLLPLAGRRAVSPHGLHRHGRGVLSRERDHDRRPHQPRPFLRRGAAASDRPRPLRPARAAASGSGPGDVRGSGALRRELRRRLVPLPRLPPRWPARARQSSVRDTAPVGPGSSAALRVGGRAGRHRHRAGRREDARRGFAVRLGGQAQLRAADDRADPSRQVAVQEPAPELIRSLPEIATMASACLKRYLKQLVPERVGCLVSVGPRVSRGRGGRRVEASIWAGVCATSTVGTFVGTSRASNWLRRSVGPA